ncbi:MAG: hypothetical protein ACE37H_11030 [Phycisphaeraceae bacterium]
MGTVPIFVLLFVVAFLTACGSQRSFSNENDKLRAERLELKEAIDELQKQAAIREGEIRALREQMDEGTEPIAGVEPPRLAGIVLGLYSGPIDLDGDKRYDELRVYVRPVDQHGRQVTAQGAARVRLLVVPADESAEPRAVLDQSFDAEQFYAAYRDGITGTHYTLGAALPADPPTSATLRVDFTDAATGRRYFAEKRVALVRGDQ